MLKKIIFRSTSIFGSHQVLPSLDAFLQWFLDLAEGVKQLPLVHLASPEQLMAPSVLLEPDESVLPRRFPMQISHYRRRKKNTTRFSWLPRVMHAAVDQKALDISHFRNCERHNQRRLVVDAISFERASRAIFF